MAINVAGLKPVGRIESIMGQQGAEPQYDEWYQTPEGVDLYRRPDGQYYTVNGGQMYLFDQAGNLSNQFATGGGSFWDNTLGKYGLGQIGTDIANDPKFLAFLATAAGGAYASSVAGGAGTAAAGTGAAEVGAGTAATGGAGTAATGTTAAAGTGGITATQAVGGASAASSALGSGGGGGGGGQTAADYEAWDAAGGGQAGTGLPETWYDQILREYGKPAADALRSGLAKNPNLVGTIGDLLGGYLGSDAAKDAAQMQIDATKLGIDEVRRQYDQTRADQLPWMEAGKRALGTLEGQLPELTSRFTPEDLTNDPGYKFQLDQGLDAITAAGRAGGSLDSGATLKALLEYGQGHAGKFYNEAFNRDQVSKTGIYNMLSGLSGTGQTTAQQLATTGAGASQSIAGLIGQGGNAAAAGEIGSTNAWLNALNNTSNRSQQNSWMDRLFNNRSGGGGWSNFFGG